MVYRQFESKTKQESCCFSVGMKTEIILAALRTILTNVLMFATTDAQTATESQFYEYFCTFRDLFLFFFSFLVMIVNLKLNAYL